MNTLIFKITPTKIIIIGYIFIILLGMFLLMLPVSSRTAESATLMEALFTATSATCVTGLVLHDTYTYWSSFGQWVILLLIQVGGMGFVTLAIAAATFTRQKIGLKQRFLMQEAIAAPQMSGIIRLARFVISGVFLCEMIGTILLSFRFCPVFGLKKGLFFAFFHSVSAFCNAGFDLIGALEPNSSLTLFSSDVLFNIVIMALIVLGGLGFVVWEDVWHHKFCWRKYRLQTKIVLSTTGLLVLASAILLFMIEYNGSAYTGMGVGDKIMASFFQSITPRTAGFNTIPLHQLKETSVLLLTILMLIGGSPGSTAGGFKTTTAFVLFLSIRAALKQKPSLECFQRRLDDHVMQSAVTMVMLYVSFFITATLLITWIDTVPLSTAAFECASAIGTVGLSLGITADLSIPSQLILILLMYLGRVGCLTLIYAFSERNAIIPSKLPLGKVIIG